jgi:MSHA biogenesis protein MshQ
MIAWWPGETNVQDLSGNANHAQLQNGAQAGVTGLVGGAFQFDGINDVALTPLLLPPQGTIEFWVNPTSLNGVHGLLGTLGLANGSDRLWIIAQGPSGGFIPNTLRVNVGDNATDDLLIPNPLVVGSWAHVAVSFDYTAENYLLYVNGQQVAVSTASRSGPTQAVRFGGVTSDFAQTFFFKGLLDEISIYDQVLPPEEIQAIVQAGSAGKCTDAADLDGDGVLSDACPASDLQPTVLIGACDSGVVNAGFPSGCTLADVLNNCQGSQSPKKAGRCIRRLAEQLRTVGVLTAAQQASIAACSR